MSAFPGMTVPERFPLAVLPTPLTRVPRLEQELGARPLYFKRDDLAGFALAGNKARKLEFLLADARERGCDVLLTGGGPGSNHCQAAAAAARVAGLSCLLVLYGHERDAVHPNLALARSFDADVRFTNDPDRASVDRELVRWSEMLQAAGRKPYLVARGGATPRGAIGFALAARELAQQMESERAIPEVIVVATGSCGTQAGLVAGFSAIGKPWRVIGASVSRPVVECSRRVLLLAQECSTLLGAAAPQASDVRVEDARGPGYGIASAEGTAAAALVARTEGILLDPVYTAKAFAVLVRMIDGLAGAAVFWHTGGIPSAVNEAMDKRWTHGAQA